MCYDEIGPCPQNIDTIPGSMVNTNGRVYVFASREGESALQPLMTFASQLRFSNLK